MTRIFADYTDESSIFDLAIAKSDFEFTEALTSFIEYVSDSFFVTESEQDSLVTSIKKFFANLISAIQNFVNSIKLEIDKNVRWSTTDTKLHKTYKELLKQKNAGCKEVKVMDVWTLSKEYVDDVNIMKKLAKKFAKMKYTSSATLNKDISEFNSLFEQCNRELEEIANTVITVPIDKMIQFVEDEISNRSQVFDTLNECITLMQQMKDDTELIQKRYEMLGTDIVPKQVSFIKKVSTKIVTFIKKWVVRILSKIVFIFA